MDEQIHEMRFDDVVSDVSQFGINVSRTKTALPIKKSTNDRFCRISPRMQKLAKKSGFLICHRGNGGFGSTE